MGYLLGKEKQTVGNLDHEPRTYYSFRNVPYARVAQRYQA